MEAKAINSAISLLNGVATVIKHEREVEKIKGEKFNVFSILGLERLENRTHSAFLCELLNPNGSHLMGSVFLQSFLKHFNWTGHIDVKTAKTVMEYHIGTVDFNKQEGGRIDIFISDDDGCCISIENKIDAGDQKLQIVRYCNYNKGKNKVLYLTPNGREASPYSCDKLIAQEHYFVASYQTDIIAWLSDCIKEAAEVPIVRESIKQYLLLIKKITHTMDSESQKELLVLMLNHYEEAAYIADNFPKIRQNQGEMIRQSVIALLKSQLDISVYDVKEGAKSTNVYSQIWITLKQFPKAKLCFGIESFSGFGWFGGDLFVGILNEGAEKTNFTEIHGNWNINKLWIEQIVLDDLEGMKMNIQNLDTLKKLYTDNEFNQKFIAHIVSQVKQFLMQRTPILIKILTDETKLMPQQL